jgi:steroid delta-isomerase-like uncharacterized protein
MNGNRNSGSRSIGGWARAVAASAASLVAGLVIASASTANAAGDNGNSGQGVSRSTIEANKNVVLTFLNDVLNGHHGDHAAQYFTSDAQFHAGTLGTFSGRANVAGVLAGVVWAIPDLHASLQDIVGEGDTVVVRLVVTGNLEHDFIGLPGNGQHLQWDAVDVYRLSNGSIAEEWAAEDLTAILHDAGVYTAPWIQ